MKFKTAICLIFASTFSSLPIAHANFSGDTWIFHSPTGDKTYKRCDDGELGSPRVDLKLIVRDFNLELSGKDDFVLKENKQDALLRKDKQREARFSTRHTTVILPWRSIELSAKPKYVGDALCVPLDFGDRVLMPFLTGQAPVHPNEFLRYTAAATVLIDPGHGGNDWGATENINGKLLKEKDFTLEFAKELQATLKNIGIAAALTRTADVFVALSEREEMVARFHPKIVISLHLNTHGMGRGFEIFTLSTFHKDRAVAEIIAKQKNVQADVANFENAAKQEVSIQWAAELSSVLKEFLPPLQQGIRRESFYLLQSSDSPALLMELGYLDREEDRAVWLNAEHRKAIWQKLASKIKQKLQ